MNKLLKRSLSIILVLLVLAYIIGNKSGWFESAPAGKTEQAAGIQEKLPVSVVVLSPGGLSDVIVATGTVLADEQVDLSAEVSGRITSIRFTEGAAVSKGDLLATINDAELLAQIEKNSFTLKLAAEREARQRTLLEREAVSQEVYDKALTELNTVQAETGILNAQLMKTRIKAPFSGTIGLRQVSEGAYVMPGQRIATLTRTQPVKIEFSVPERFAASVKKGSLVQFSIEGNEKPFKAAVYAVEPRIDPQTRSLTVRALYSNLQNELNPGSFARVEFRLSHMDNAITVPAQAIVPELGGYKVFVYRSGLAEAIKVSVGIRTSDAVQVLDGLKAGDTVVTTGILQIRAGLPLMIDQLSQQKP